jgi:hypothetical protein
MQLLVVHLFNNLYIMKANKHESFLTFAIKPSKYLPWNSACNPFSQNCLLEFWPTCRLEKAIDVGRKVCNSVSVRPARKPSSFRRGFNACIIAFIDFFGLLGMWKRIVSNCASRCMSEWSAWSELFAYREGGEGTEGCKDRGGVGGPRLLLSKIPTCASEISAIFVRTVGEDKKSHCRGTINIQIHNSKNKSTQKKIKKNDL